MQLDAGKFKSISVHKCANGNSLRALTAVLLMALLVSGCATLNRSECEAGQWQEIGYHDGARGRGNEFLGLHQRACAKHGVDVAEPLYNNGYLAGLADFCQPQTAYRLGRNEEIYNYACPSEFERPFVVAYVDGLTETMRELQLHEHFLEDRLWYATVRYQSLQTSHVDPSEEDSAETPAQVLRETRVLGALRDGVDNYRDRRARIRNALARANRFLQTTAAVPATPATETNTETNTETPSGN